MTNNTTYKHTQIGHLIIFTSIFVFFNLAIVLTKINQDPSLVITLFLVFLLLLSFTTLTVTINKKHLQAKFGYGLFGKRFPLKTIISAKTVKNRWYYGWGIRFWIRPRIWIYNVSGFDAVEIKLKNGKVYRIGTNEPKKLASSIIKAIK